MPRKFDLNDPVSIGAYIEGRSAIAANGCRNWIGALDGHGYGNIRKSIDGVGMNYRAHRLAMVARLGRWIPSSEHVLHSCDNPLCVNTEHLRIGTHAENLHEMAVKDRAYAKRRKLTTADAEAILRAIFAGIPRKQLAAQYGVALVTIHAIATRRLYAHARSPADDLPSVRDPMADERYVFDAEQARAINRDYR